MTAAPEVPLRLKAIDAEDVGILSACLQDALILIDDMAYLPEERRFALVANRFLWERAQPAPASRARVKAAVGIEHVTRVWRQGLDRGRGDGLVVLLAIRLLPGALHLMFAGGAAIRLEVSDVLCHLQDVGEAWPTPWRPDHDRTP